MQTSPVLTAVIDVLTLEKERVEALKCELIEVATTSNGLKPDQDEFGRLISPSNNYRWYSTLFDKGQFLPIEGDYRSYVANEERRKIKISASDLIALKDLGNQFGFHVSNGKIWIDGDGEVCYAYIGVLSESTFNKIVQLSSKGKGLAPEGRQEVVGTILKISDSRADKPEPVGFYSDDHVPTLKMLVELPNKSTVYSTIPLCIREHVKEGDLIKLKATFKSAKGDRSHSYGSRPSQDSEILSSPPMAQGSFKGITDRNQLSALAIDRKSSLESLIGTLGWSSKAQEWFKEEIETMCSTNDSTVRAMCRGGMQGMINALFAEGKLSDADHALIGAFSGDLYYAVR